MFLDSIQKTAWVCHSDPRRVESSTAVLLREKNPEWRADSRSKYYHWKSALILRRSRDFYPEQAERVGGGRRGFAQDEHEYVNKKLINDRGNRFLASLGMTFISSKTMLLVVLAAILFILPNQSIAQPPPSKSTIKVVLISGGTSGLSVGESDYFFSTLQRKLSQFTSLSVFLKADFAKGLNKEDKAALEKCSSISCVQSIAGKAGFQKVLLCRIIKKNSAYQFQSDEFDVKKVQRLSEITDNADCSSASDVDNFIREAAVKVGQMLTHGTSVPESLQESKSNLWWYIGTAAAVGVAAGVYFNVEHQKQNNTTPTSLPLPPNFP